MRTEFGSRDRIRGNSPMLRFLNQIRKSEVFRAAVIYLTCVGGSSGSRCDRPRLASVALTGQQGKH